MPEQLTQGIVRILDVNRDIAGTGFVISESGLIATCSHVIQHEELQKRGAPRPEEVTIIFHATGDEREARVEPDWWLPWNDGDLAIMQVEGILPQGVRPLPLGPAEGTNGHEVCTFGFPDVGDIEGLGGDGRVVRVLPNTGRSILQLRSNEITAGFSGAPIWDKLRRHVIGMVSAIAEPDRHHRLVETAFALSADTLRSVCPELYLSEDCPYHNLDAFTEADEAFFFGRTRVINDLINSLRSEPSFLAVLGPSGCGKSSVVQAGLIPNLRQGAVPGSDHWEIIITRPTDHNFADLVVALQQTQQYTVLVIDQFEEFFVTSPATAQQAVLTHLTRLLDRSPGTSIILTLRDDFYSHFVQHETLAQCLRRGLINIPPFLKREELMAIVQGPAEILGLNFEPGLVEVIVKDSTEAVNVPEECDGVGRSTILPLLEFTLTQLWERREEGMLTHAAYEKIGGVTGSLTQWATTTLRALDVQQRPLARRIFTDLVYLGDESQRLPYSRKRRQLDALCRAENEWEEVGHVVQRLVEARLLVTSRSSQSPGAEVEIIHDALLQEWGELRRWLEEDRRFLLWHQECERRVQAWRKGTPADTVQRDKDKLLRGHELVEAESWLTERKTDLNEEEHYFIHASREQQRQEESRWRELYEEAERQRTKAEQHQQIALGRQLAAQSELIRNQYPHLLERSVLLAVEAMRRFPSLESDQALRNGLALFPQRRLASLSFGGDVWAASFSPDGNYLAISSQSGSVGVWSTEGWSQIALLTHKGPMRDLAFSPDGRFLVTASWDRTAKVWETTNWHHLISLAHKKAVLSIAFSPNGRYLVTGSKDCTAKLWDTSSWEQLASLVHEKDILDVAFSPDGRYCATASHDCTVKVWEVNKSQEVAKLIHRASVNAVVFSPDGTCVATASEDLTARVWEIPGGLESAFLLHNGPVFALAFNPDGSYLATASGDHTAKLWDVEIGYQLLHQFTHKQDVYYVAFNSDGRYLATASDDGTAGVWETKSGRQLICLPQGGRVYTTAFSPDGSSIVTTSSGNAKVWETTSHYRRTHLSHALSVECIAFSPDGCYLATASRDDSAKMWEVSSGHQLTCLTHKNSVWAVTFSPDGRYLATACWDHTAKVWEASSGRQLIRLTHKKGHVRAVSFSPDGRYLATASDDGTAGVWEVNSGHQLARLTHDEIVRDVTFSPDGRYLATASDDGTAKVWEASSGHQLARLVHKRFVYRVTFSPDGRYLATASYDHTAGLWEVGSGHQLAQLTHNAVVDDVVFSPDGRYLATASWDHTAGLWDVSNGNQLAGLPHENIVNAVAFSPDGHYLATACSDGTAGVWEMSIKRQMARLVHEDQVTAVAFSPDGKYIATASDDGTAGMWLWHPEDLISEAQCHLTRNLTQSEWEQYIGDEPYRETYPNLL